MPDPTSSSPSHGAKSGGGQSVEAANDEGATSGAAPKSRPTGDRSATEAEPGPDIMEIDHRADAQVPWRVFGGVGAFIAVMAAIYWFTSYENAGSVMLVVASILGLWAGIFLWRAGRRLEVSASQSGALAEEGTAFLPAASPWPMGVGLGLTLVLNGLLIGIWFLIPGLMVLGVGIAGWASQSRHRRLH